MTQQHHRAASIFAGIFTLLQSIIWVVLTILLIASYTCHLNLPFNVQPSETTVSYLLYVTYFRGECRHDQVTASASRTYVWMIIYAIFSAIWIPTSVLLFVAAIGNVKGKYGASLYYPWILTTGCIQLIDLIATVFYAIDITQTMTVSDYRTFISPATVNLKEADGLTVIPAIELTAFFCRAIVVWCINLILLGVVIQGARCVAKNKPQGTNYSNNIRKSAFQGAEDDRSQCSGEPIREHAAKQRWANVFYGGDSPQDTPQEEDVTLPRWQYAQQQHQYQQQQHQQQQPWIITQGGNFYNRDSSWDRPYGQQQQYQQQQQQQQHPSSAYQQEDVNRHQQQQKQYPSAAYQQEDVSRHHEQPQQVYSEPHKVRGEAWRPSGRDTPASTDNSINDRTFDVNGKPINDTPAYNRKYQNKGQNVPTSPTKKEVSKWSYITPGSEILAKVREGLKPVGPPVPLPDYSVHIPAVKRYPSIPAELQAAQPREEAGRSQITRSSSMSNVY